MQMEKQQEFLEWHQAQTQNAIENLKLTLIITKQRIELVRH